MLHSPHCVCAGSVPVALQFGPQGPAKEPAAGRFDKAVWEPEEWCERHKNSQVVCHDRLDCHLPAEGEPLSLSLI